MSIGWLAASEDKDGHLRRACEHAAEDVRARLQQIFPNFSWESTVVGREWYPAAGAIDPLDLLETGLEEKLRRKWDFCLTVVSNELEPREQNYTMATPSSALETAILSAARLGEDGADMTEQLAALALHCLGHLWGLEHGEGIMRPPADPGELTAADLTSKQIEAIRDRLDEVADERLEERAERPSRIRFYWQSFALDPKGILTDTIGIRPWMFPFRMGRLTAAAGVSGLLLLLGAEAWELGVSFAGWQLAAGAAAAIAAATVYVFIGQRLGAVSRSRTLTEQVARTRIVLFCSLFIGIAALYAILFAVALVVVFAAPDPVVTRWLPTAPAAADLCGHAGFIAMLGVLAGALGGNLEEASSIKAQLFIDEET